MSFVCSMLPLLLTAALKASSSHVLLAKAEQIQIGKFDDQRVKQMANNTQKTTERNISAFLSYPLYIRRKTFLYFMGNKPFTHTSLVQFYRVCHGFRPGVGKVRPAGQIRPAEAMNMALRVVFSSQFSYISC